MVTFFIHNNKNGKKKLNSHSVLNHKTSGS